MTTEVLNTEARGESPSSLQAQECLREITSYDITLGTTYLTTSFGPGPGKNTLLSESWLSQNCCLLHPRTQQMLTECLIHTRPYAKALKRPLSHPSNLSIPNYLSVQYEDSRIPYPLM